MNPTIRKSFIIKKSPPPRTLCPKDIEKFLSSRHNPSWFMLGPKMAGLPSRSHMGSLLVPRLPSELPITTILSKLNFNEEIRDKR